MNENVKKITIFSVCVIIIFFHDYLMVYTLHVNWENLLKNNNWIHKREYYSSPEKFLLSLQIIFSIHAVLTCIVAYLIFILGYTRLPILVTLLMYVFISLV